MITRSMNLAAISAPQTAKAKPLQEQTSVPTDQVSLNQSSGEPNAKKLQELFAKARFITEKWHPPSKGDSRELGKKLVERLALRNHHRSDVSPKMKKDLDQAVLVHEFSLDNFGSVAHHGFLSTAQTYSDKAFGHDRRLLKPQEMAHINLDLSNQTHRELVPKYAFTVFPRREAQKGFPMDTDYPLSYGQASAVLKSDVKERSSWSYGDSLSLRAGKGPRSEAHTFTENELRKDMVDSCHFLESQIWGKLGLEDVDHFVIDAWVPREMQEYQEQVDSGKYDGPKHAKFLNSIKTSLSNYHAMLKVCEALEIPVYAGYVSSRLDSTHDKQGKEIRPAFDRKQTLVEGTPADRRPEFDPSKIQAILGSAAEQSGEAGILPEGVFEPGQSAQEQAERFSEFQIAARKERMKDF